MIHYNNIYEELLNELNKIEKIDNNKIDVCENKIKCVYADFIFVELGKCEDADKIKIYVYIMIGNRKMKLASEEVSFLEYRKNKGFYYYGLDRYLSEKKYKAEKLVDNIIAIQRGFLNM